MVSAGECSGGGEKIAILGAGSLGRLWAAFLPSGSCGFLPRLSGDWPHVSKSGSEDGFELGSSFSRQESFPETRCEYVLVRSASPSMATQGFGEAFLTASPDPVQERILISRPRLSTVRNLELLLVTTKAGDTLAALNDWLPRISEDTSVILFQNGLGSQQAVAEHWPDRPILAASTTEGANRPSPDVLVHAGAGDTWVGALTDSATGRTTGVVQQLAATGLRTHTEHTILPRLWQKLVINAGINSFTALLDCANGEILGSSLYQQVIDDLCAEVALLLQAETSECVRPEALRERIEAIARSTASNTSSMRADVKAGRKTEIDYINGYLVQCGQKHGIATPANQMLTERVKALSAS